MSSKVHQHWLPLAWCSKGLAVSVFLGCETLNFSSNIVDKGCFGKKPGNKEEGRLFSQEAEAGLGRAPAWLLQGYPMKGCVRVWGPSIREGTSLVGEGDIAASAEYWSFPLSHPLFHHLLFSPPSHFQVKIWFQNRRAKERKINKKKLQQQQQPPPSAPQPPQPQPGPLRSVPEPLSPVSSLQGSVPGSVPGVLGPGGVLNPTVTQ